MKLQHYLTAAGILLLAACSDKKETSDTTDTASPSNDNTAFTSLIVSDAPKDAKTIYSIRKTAKPGDTLTVKGKVMGRVDPFVPGRAIMMLGDSEIITSCDLIPGDNCETPWDVCCDDPDTIKESTLSVQVLDQDGNLVKSGLKGVSGIKELSELIVTGTVAEGSNKDNLILTASSIYVKP